MSFFTLLLNKIKAKKAKIGVIGQGYVGLPLAILLAKKGFRVTGLDVDQKKVETINQGRSYLPEMGIDKDLKGVIQQGCLKATSAIVSGCKKQDVIIICVPTPIDSRHQPDIRLLKKAANSIGLAKPRGKLIVNESTVAPSTTLSVVGKIIEKKSGLIPGKDFFLGCSPERINPGDAAHQLENIPKIVAGLGKEDLLLTEALYRSIIKAKLVKASSLAVAETAKLLENSYRAVNIALVNELAKFCQQTGLDVLAIIEAAKTKWSFQAHYPGVGVGGHCIPVDPYYLLDTATKKKVKMPVLRQALAENESMPRFLLANFLKFYRPNDQVLVYGIAYKAGVKDARESPALKLCRLMKKKGIKFEVYDPFYTAREINRFGYKACLSKYQKEKFNHYDILVVATGHQQLAEDAKTIVNEKTIIIDGRNFFKKKTGREIIGVGRRFE